MEACVGPFPKYRMNEIRFLPEADEKGYQITGGLFCSGGETSQRENF